VFSFVLKFEEAGGSGTSREREGKNKSESSSSSSSSSCLLKMGSRHQAGEVQCPQEERRHSICSAGQRAPILLAGLLLFRYVIAMRFHLLLLLLPIKLLAIMAVL
jgi:hypothetical protein